MKEKQEEPKEKKETEEEILERNLLNPVFVNYNIIKNLEEIKILLNLLYQKSI